MYDNDPELTRLLESAALSVTPDRARADAVRQRMLALAPRTSGRARRYAVAGMVFGGALLICGVGLAGTQAGRDLIRRLFTPVEEIHATQWQGPDGTLWSEGGAPEPYAPEQEQAAARKFAEMDAIQKAGGGRLVGLIEGAPPAAVPGDSFTVYEIEYTLAGGETMEVGSSIPTGKQAENLRIAEIMRLRDEGAGEVMTEKPWRFGLGKYTLRFTLSDGQTVDLKTNFPPGTRQERARIFAEMRRLKAERRFVVLSASRTAERPHDGVWGILRYTLADGRVVGATEQVPDDLISADGTMVVMPDTHEAIAIQPSGDQPQ